MSNICKQFIAARPGTTILSRLGTLSCPTHNCVTSLPRSRKAHTPPTLLRPNRVELLRREIKRQNSLLPRKPGKFVWTVVYTGLHAVCAPNVRHILAVHPSGVPFGQHDRELASEMASWHNICAPCKLLEAESELNYRTAHCSLALMWRRCTIPTDFLLHLAEVPPAGLKAKPTMRFTASFHDGIQVLT